MLDTRRGVVAIFPNSLSGDRAMFTGGEHERGSPGGRGGPRFQFPIGACGQLISPNQISTTVGASSLGRLTDSASSRSSNTMIPG